MLVKELLHFSPLRLVTVLHDDSIKEAARRMARFQVGFIVVMDDQDDFVGVLSERDIVSGMAEPEIIIEEVMVHDLMTESIVNISSDEPLINAALAMNSQGIRHLVVTESSKPIGVLSIRDVLRIFASQVLNIEGNADGQFTMDFAKALAAA